MNPVDQVKLTAEAKRSERGANASVPIGADGKDLQLSYTASEDDVTAAAVSVTFQSINVEIWSAVVQVVSAAGLVKTEGADISIGKDTVTVANSVGFSIALGDRITFIVRGN